MSLTDLSLPGFRKHAHPVGCFVNHLVNLFVRAAAAELRLASPVLEIGSFQVPGQEEMANLRTYFPSCEYIGTDMRPGPGVDRVEDAHNLSFPDRSIGTILMMETIEHIVNPIRALSEVRRVLRPGGVLVLSAPFALDIHNHPSDYWRMTPEGCNVLLEAIGARLVGSIGPRVAPCFVLGAAFIGEDSAVFKTRCAALVERFRAELRADRATARLRRLYQGQRWLTGWLPFKEVRRVYRRRAQCFDTHFWFSTGSETVSL